jgi:hypothetical protein
VPAGPIRRPLAQSAARSGLDVGSHHRLELVGFVPSGFGAETAERPRQPSPPNGPALTISAERSPTHTWGVSRPMTGLRSTAAGLLSTAPARRVYRPSPRPRAYRRPETERSEGEGSFSLLCAFPVVRGSRMGHTQPAHSARLSAFVGPPSAFGCQKFCREFLTPPVSILPGPGSHTKRVASHALHANAPLAASGTKRTILPGAFSSLSKVNPAA